MKVSEITVKDITNYLRLSEVNDDDNKNIELFLNIAKNKMWILGRIKFVTKADKARKQQIIKMYRYMYRNVEKPVSIQCTLCYFFPYLYNKMRERLKFKRNFMHVL